MLAVQIEEGSSSHFVPFLLFGVFGCSFRSWSSEETGDNMTGDPVHVISDRAFFLPAVSPSSGRLCFDPDICAVQADVRSTSSSICASLLLNISNVSDRLRR